MERLHTDFDLQMEIEFIYTYTSMIPVKFYSHPYWFRKGNGLYWLINELFKCHLVIFKY